MLQRFYYEASKSTPEIDFNPETGKLKIEGQSYPENAFKFYEPVIQWVEKYLEDSDFQSKVILDLHLIYLNTSSSKCMLDLFDMLDRQNKAVRSAKIVWRYDEENDMALELGEEFKEGLSIEFEIIKISGEDDDGK